MWTCSYPILNDARMSLPTQRPWKNFIGPLYRIYWLNVVVYWKTFLFIPHISSIFSSNLPFISRSLFLYSSFLTHCLPLTFMSVCLFVCVFGFMVVYSFVCLCVCWLICLYVSLSLCRFVFRSLFYGQFGLVFKDSFETELYCNLSLGKPLKKFLCGTASKRGGRVKAGPLKKHFWSLFLAQKKFRWPLRG